MIPKSLKTALSRPLLKNAGLNSDISKKKSPCIKLQSPYRDKHCTKTYLITVQNDILSALDARSSAILLMLDLSVAFDTIDHDILLSR